MGKKRLIIYFSLIALFALAIIIKKNQIINARLAPVVSIIHEWKEKGRPVDVLTVKRGNFPYRVRLSVRFMGEKTGLRAYVTPAVAELLRSGQDITATIGEGEQTHEVKGMVTSVSGRDLETGLSTIVMQLTKTPKLSESGRIIPMDVLVTTYQGVIRVPKEALVKEKEGTFLWIIKDNKAKKITVKPGLEDAEWVVIKEGLNDNSEVVVRGMSKLSEDSKVFYHEKMTLGEVSND